MIQMVSAGGIGAGADRFGIFAAMVTPFRADGSIDLPRAVAHGKAVLARGAQGLTLFGTTGEGASIGTAERGALIAALLGAGVAPEQVTVTICASALADALAQAREAFGFGIRKLLLVPPYYFKGVSEAALEGWFAAFLGAVAAGHAQVILYHIPQVTQIALPVPMIRRLKDRFGDLVFGVKDSSGDWENSRALLEFSDLAVLIGDERYLARAAALGGAGAISGVANLFPRALSAMIRTGQDNAAICALVDALVTVPVTPAVKAMVGLQAGEDGWGRVRAPLAPTPEADVARIGRHLAALGE
jgi:4-hydroxy-tetrahydrodipicolinate synthase